MRVTQRAASRIIQRSLDLSKPGLVLSVAQKESYEENGFVLVKSCVAQNDIERYRQRFQAICQKTAAIPSTMTVMKDVSIKNDEFQHGESTITKVQDFGDEPVLFEYCKHESILQIVKDVIGCSRPETNLMAMHTMLINKPPDCGQLTSRHPMHQDLIYFPFRPAEYICCAWTAMEKIDKSNGCLEVVPGSHNLGLLPHAYPDWEGGVNKAYYGVQGFEVSSQRVAVPMEPGDTIFFHPILVHGSGANLTKGFRKAISCHYANDDHCHYIDVKGTIQEEVGTEITDMVRKKAAKFGFNYEQLANMSFSETWRLRGRPVSGTRKNL